MDKNQVRLSYSFGTSKGEVLAEMLGFRPLKLRVIEGGAQQFQNASGQKVLIDVKEFDADEVLLHTILTKAAGDVLELESLGQNDMREYMRINSLLEMSFKVIEDPSLAELDDIAQKLDVSQVIQLNAVEMRQLAETDAASEAMLFLLQAVQNIHQKLDGLIELSRRHMLMPAESRMFRRRVNISGNGIRFQAHEALQMGAVVKVVLRLPLKEPYDVQLLAEVVRVDKMPAAQQTEEFKVEVACKFAKIRDYDREKIIAFTLQKQREILRRWRGTF